VTGPFLPSANRLEKAIQPMRPLQKILLVDDQPHIIRVIRLSLERRGYEVHVASDGAEALEKLCRTHFDILITDFEMPRMDGRQLCDKLRSTLPDLKPFTFVVTAETNPELREWARGLDDTEFLEKPLSLRQLGSRLDSHFSATTSAAE